MNINDSEHHLSEQAPELVPEKPSIAKRLLQAVLVALLFAGLGMGIGMAYHWVKPRLYQSQARIFVEGPIYSGKQGLTPENYVSILKSDQILVRAIELGEFEKFEIFADSEPLQALRDGESLLLEREREAYAGKGKIYYDGIRFEKSVPGRKTPDFIRLAFTGSNPEECSKVLQGVIDSLVEFIKASNDAQKQSTEHLSDSLTTARDELKKVEDEIQSLTANLTTRDPNQEQRLEALRKQQGRLEHFYNVAVDKVAETEVVNQVVRRRHVGVLDPPTKNPPLIGLNLLTCSVIGLILGGFVGTVVASVRLLRRFLL